MRIIWDRGNIVLVKFPNRYLMCSTMMRLSEYKESPNKEIYNKFFDIEKFMDTYAEDNGTFSYTNDWSGFNIPSEDLKIFYGVFKDDLTRKEQAFYDLVKYKTHGPDDFYIIVVVKDDVIDHELCHAFYILDENYKKNVEEEVAKYEYVKELKEAIIKGGYPDREDTLIDEAQAYLATSKPWELKKSFKFTKPLYNEKIVKIFKEKKKAWMNIKEN